MDLLILVTKEEAMFIRTRFPNRLVEDLYSDGFHVEKVIRRTRNHYWCTETAAVLQLLEEFRKNKMSDGVLKHGK